MPTKITEEIRAKADEFYEGHEICSEKSKFLLSQCGLPTGLLPLKDMIECGYIKETGFVWMKQKKKIQHKFKQIGKLVSYSDLITAHIEENTIKKLTGVKAKELLIWITINDISLEVPPTGKLKFQSLTGLFRLFPSSAFEEIVGEEKSPDVSSEEGQEEEEEEEEEEDEKKVGEKEDEKKVGEKEDEKKVGEEEDEKKVGAGAVTAPAAAVEVKEV